MAEPIKDAQGRIRYIVDLAEDFSGKPETFKDVTELIDWHKANSARLIDDVVKLRGVDILGTTSLVGTSFTAYLDEKEADRLRKDKRVVRVTLDAHMAHSALWSNTATNGGQLISWGRQAMGVSGNNSTGYATVYVVDTGVEAHGDLGGLVERTSAFAGINPSGCYPHATHVAGIIGASNNSVGSAGVNPGVQMVSIALGDVNVADCSAGSPISAFVYALEMVRYRVLQRNRVGIVNISFNLTVASSGGNPFGLSGTVGAKMLSVATPSNTSGFVYPGALIVQSAGNLNDNACSFAYDAPSGFDGILVVGAIDQNGHRVVPMINLDPMNKLEGFANVPRGVEEMGSNFGGCVDMYAPGQRIYSTWSGNSMNYLSGTSMAAPHVAGLASVILEANPSLQTSIDLENAVRLRLTAIGGSGVSIPQYNQTPLTAQPTLELYEGGVRTFVQPLNTTSLAKFVDQVQLKYYVVGASYCYAQAYQNGGYYSSKYLTVPTGTFDSSILPFGTVQWNITCGSPEGSANTLVAGGLLKRRIFLGWRAKTTSTNMQWQEMPNGHTITWSVPANASFDQQHWSDGADSCEVQSYGWLGNPSWDPDNPNPNAYAQPMFFNSAPYANEPSPLWNSGYPFAASYTYATFYYGDSNAYPNPIGLVTMPYNGYKWRLTCRNAEGVSETRVMYGKPQYTW